MVLEISCIIGFAVSKNCYLQFTLVTGQVTRNLLYQVANNTAVDLAHVPCYLDIVYQYPYSICVVHIFTKQVFGC